MDKENDLKDRVALVTGATRRMGRAIAIALAGHGVHVIVHYRSNEPEAIKVCEEVSGYGSKSWKIAADLENPEEYRTLISRAVAMAGSLDIVINNASLFLPDTLMDVDFTSLSRHMQVNAWAPLVISREFARLSGKGRIVNLLDTKVTGYDRSHAGYILSKQMLSALTRMCALEFAPLITVNGVAPGLILPPSGYSDDYLDDLAKSLPLKRHGQVHDVTRAIIYLLRSDFVTGQVIYIDGGRHLLEDRSWTVS